MTLRSLDLGLEDLSPMEESERLLVSSSSCPPSDPLT